MNSVSYSAEVEMLPILLDQTSNDEDVSNIPEPVHAIESIQDKQAMCVRCHLTGQ